MPTYVLPPGAWLSAGALQPGIGGNGGLDPGIGGHRGLQPGIGGHAALDPGIGGHAALDPGIGGHAALDPGIGGHAFLDPGIGRPRPREPGTLGWGPLHWSPAAESPAGRLTAAAARLTTAAPWRGRDATWLYQHEGGLQAAALGRAGERLLRMHDPRREGPDGPFVSARRIGTEGESPLWRWGGEPRVLAVVADLNWRFAVSDSTLWYLSRADDDGRRVSFEESLSFEAVPQGGKWLETQIDKVLRAAVEREERLPEILTQADDFMAFFVHLSALDPRLAPITFELLHAAHLWARPLVMALKHQVAALRPNASSTRVLPVIETPAHGALPSGHAAIATLMSELLGTLLFGKAMPGPTRRHPKAQQLDRLARRIAFNRVVAGVHFPADSQAGYALGLQLSAHFVGLATGGPQPGRYDLQLGGNGEQGLDEFGERPEMVAPRAAGNDGTATSEPLKTLWDAACRELAQLGVEGVPT